jgi:hypothetical protein
MFSQQLLIVLAEPKIRKRVAAVKTQHSQAGRCSGTEPFEGFPEKEVVGLGQAVGWAETMFGRNGLEILDYKPRPLAAAEEDPAGFGSAPRDSGENLTHLAIDTSHNAAADHDVRAIRGVPIDVIDFDFLTG